MFLFCISGRVSARVRGDVECADLANDIAQSLRKAGLEHIEATSNKVSFSRNYSLIGLSTRIYIMVNKGDFLVRLDQGQATIGFSIATKKLWGVVSPLLLLFVSALLFEGDSGVVSISETAVGLWLWFFGMNYLIILVRTRMFLFRSIRKFSDANSASDRTAS